MVLLSSQLSVGSREPMDCWCIQDSELQHFGSWHSVASSGEHLTHPCQRRVWAVSLPLHLAHSSMVCQARVLASRHLGFGFWYILIDSDPSEACPSSTSGYSNSLSNQFEPKRGSRSCHGRMFDWAIGTLISPWSSPESISCSQSDEADRYCGAASSIWYAGIISWSLSSLLLRPWRPVVGVVACRNRAESPQADSCSSCQ